MKAADLIENMALEDVITFGKHKGKTVEKIYKVESGYLVWLRQERWVKNAQPNFFNKEVNTLLDMTIAESRSLRNKYRTWKSMGLMTDVPAPELEAVRELEHEPAVAYGGWGAF